MLDRPFSNETRQTTHKNHKNSGTNVTRCHRIETSCEAAAECVAQQPKALRISFRSEGTSSSSVFHQEPATSSQTSHPPSSCVPPSSAVELSQMSGGRCREQSSTDASDSSMCGSNCASRPERASSPSRKVPRRKGNFLVAPIPVADIPCIYSFHSPVMSDDSGRNSREEPTGSTGDKKSTPLCESGTTGCGEKRKIPHPETLAESDTSNHRSRSGAIQTTTNGRLGNADFGLSALHRPESVSRECIPGMDDVSVMWSRWSRKTGRDDIQVKMGPITEQPQSTPPCPGCASTTRLQQMTNKTFFGCSRFTLCNRVVYTSLITESRVSPSAHSCPAAQPVAEQVMVLDSDSVGSEETFRMLNVPAVPAVSRQEQQLLLEQLRHLSSSGITGQEARRAIVRMFPDQQQKLKVSKAVRTLQDTMQKI